MYDENEKLELIQDVGVEGKKNFIPKGTEVTFLRVIEDSKDISKAFLLIQHEDRQIALPELVLTPKNKDTISILKDFNDILVENRPELGKYHHSPFKRFHFFLLGLLERFILSPLNALKQKILYNPVEEDKDKKVVEEIKNLLKED